MLMACYFFALLMPLAADADAMPCRHYAFAAAILMMPPRDMLLRLLPLSPADISLYSSDAILRCRRFLLMSPLDAAYYVSLRR